MRLLLLIYTVLYLCPLSLAAQVFQHPVLTITKADAQTLYAALPQQPLMQATYNDLQQQVELALKQPIEVPMPKDPAGAYTHERHKANYSLMYQAGLLYALNGDKKYGMYVINMLLTYAKLNPTLSLHPESRGNAPGILFHQALNDANWLLYAAQAYDCVYHLMTAQQRAQIVAGAFNPLIKHFTERLPSWTSMIHNHGVWASAAIGMAGIATDDTVLLKKALYGVQGEANTGFFAQLNGLFSPDGYYTEGPYYTRYALLPFFAFAQSLHQALPDIQIFAYRNGILGKAFVAAMEQTNIDGSFFPINDAIREKTYSSNELVQSIAVAYVVYNQPAYLLAIAKQQKKIALNIYGLAIAKAIQSNTDVGDYPYKTVAYRDGANGQKGGLSLLRQGEGMQLSTAIFKYSAHGLSHGHYDRLGIVLYDKGHAILTDYGSVRFVNVAPKDGGRYLPENKSFAMQTVAHNCLVVNEQSQNLAQEATAELTAPTQLYHVYNAQFSATAAVDSHSYKGVKIERIVVHTRRNNRLLLIDVLLAQSAQAAKFDLPFWYNGQIMQASAPMQVNTQSWVPLGRQYGYQHIWNVGEAPLTAGKHFFTLLSGSHYYSIHSLLDSAAKYQLLKTGANDPKQNLRIESGMMIRMTPTQKLTQINVVEQHGNYNPISEQASGSTPAISNIEKILDNDAYCVFTIEFEQHQKWLIAASKTAVKSDSKHEVMYNGKTITWTGPIAIIYP